MAIICNDFIAIAKELEEFYNIFTPELKSVTGKPHKINEILDRVHKVLELIEHVNFASTVPSRFENSLFFRRPAIRSDWKIWKSGNSSRPITPNRSMKSTNKRKVSFRNRSKRFGTPKRSFFYLPSVLHSRFRLKIGGERLRHVAQIRAEQHTHDDPRRNAQALQRYSAAIR